MYSSFVLYEVQLDNNTQLRQQCCFSSTLLVVSNFDKNEIHASRETRRSTEMLPAYPSSFVRVFFGSVSAPRFKQLLSNVEQNVVICQWRVDQLFAVAED